MARKSLMLSAWDLKQIGWTERLIADLIGKEDKTAPSKSNPYGPLMRHYYRARVEIAEKHALFLQHHAPIKKAYVAADISSFFE